MKTKPYIQVIKITCNAKTGDVAVLENIGDNRKLYKIFLSLAQQYKPIYPD